MPETKEYFLIGTQRRIAGARWGKVRFGNHKFATHARAEASARNKARFLGSTEARYTVWHAFADGKGLPYLAETSTSFVRQAR